MSDHKQGHANIIHLELMNNLKRMLANVEKMSDEEKLFLESMHTERTAYGQKMELAGLEMGIRKYVLALVPTDVNWKPVAKSFGSYEDDVDTVLHTSPVPEFRELLSEKAKAIYDTKLNTTIAEVAHCLTCDERWLKPKAEMTIGPNGIPENILPLGKHEGHTVNLECKLVQYLGTIVEATHQMLLMKPDAMKIALERRVKQMAHAFNIGVEKGWLKYGVLTQAITLPLYTMSAAKRSMLLLYVASDYSRDELNKLYGCSVGDKEVTSWLFVHEGELPSSEAFDEWAKHNL